MPKQISFIHAADLHLDSPFQGLSTAPEHIFNDIRRSTFTALNELVHVAIEKEVDFVLLVGDLFDNESQSLQAQIRLRTACEQLAEKNISVYLSYGNHDHIQGNTYSVTFPDNVFVFPNEDVSHFTYYKEGQRLAQIYGFSYEGRAVRENKTLSYQIHDEQIPFHIATLHGSIRGNTEHDVYAPFQIRDLLQEPFTYWALGHIHKRQILRSNPPIVYPGNTQGRHRKEIGQKGCYYVTLTETDETLTFIPLQAIKFTSITIDLADVSEIHEVEEVILQKIEALESEKPLLIDLTLKNTDHLQLADHHEITDFVDIIHDSITDQKNWRYIYSTAVKNYTDTEPVIGSDFIGQLAKQFEEVQLHDVLASLYDHRQARKYLQRLTNEEQQSIKEEAKQLLFHKLLRE